MANTDLINSLVSNGWEESPFKYAFHPTPERRYEEYIGMMRNLKKLSREKDSKIQNEDLPGFDEFCMDLPDEEVDPDREFIEIMGLCLWDIFSDNHEVVAYKAVYGRFPEGWPPV